MPIKRGNTNIGTVYRGNTEIATVYEGNTTKYENTPPVPTTRIGAWIGDPDWFDQSWHTESLTDIGSTYNGRTVRLVLIHRTATTGTTYQADMQIDRIRYGGTTFDMDSGEAWRRDNEVAASTSGTYASRLLDSNELVGTTPNTAQKWCRDADATTSTNTGSLTPTYGGYTLYTEASSTALGDYFWVMSPEFTYTSGTADIILGMDGDTCGTFVVYIVDSTTTTFTPSFSSPTELFQATISTTRIGCYQGSTSIGDTTWRAKDITDVGTLYDGASARIVLVYQNGSGGTQFYQGDIQIDRIRYGGQTFDFSSDEDWRRDNTAAASTAGTYATRLLDANVACGTSVPGNGFWGRDTNATTSSNTGGALPSYGSYTLFPETSSTGYSYYFWAMSPTFTYNSNATHSMEIAMQGDNCGILSIYLVDASTTDFTPSFSSPTAYYPVTQTTTPEINNEICADIAGTKYPTWYVRNKDLTTATIFSEVSDTSPETSRGTVAYNVNTSMITGPSGLTGNINIYATASKGGTWNNADISLYDSATVNMDGFCSSM